MWKKQILVGIQLVLLLLVGFCGFKVFTYNQNLKQTDTIQASSQQLLTDVLEKSDSLSLEQKQVENIDFVNQLKNEYPASVGYIRIVDTIIDYPIVQAGDNDYYLDHAPDDTYNENGSIFLDYRNGNSFNDDNSIIYGHYIKSGKLFYALDQFRDQAFYDAGSIIEIYTVEGLKIYKVFSVYDVDPDFDYRITSYGNAVDKKTFIESALSRSVIKTYVPDDLLSNKNTKMLTLSTCSNNGDTRLVVHALELKKLLPK